MHTRRTGFTLMEMAGVVIIIGLVVGGIMIMQSVIHAAKLQKILTEYDTYTKAIQEFEDKYQVLPGDMTNAQTLWGSLSAPVCAGTTAVTTLTSGNATCNGNGDGMIGTSDSTGVVGTGIEWFSAWQHLSNSQLISGSFTGATDSASAFDAQPGLNVPASGFSSSAGWTLFYIQCASTNVRMWGDQYGHVLTFGSNASGAYTRGPIISPIDSYTLDQKIDDGFPGTGKVRSWRAALVPNCTTNDTSQTAATYNYTDQKNDCSLFFLLGI